MLEKSNAIHMYLAVSAPLYFMAKTVRDTVGETDMSSSWILGVSEIQGKQNSKLL